MSRKAEQSPDLAPEPVRAADVPALVAEMGLAYERTVRWHMEQMQLSLVEADQRARHGASADLDRLREMPPEQLSWGMLNWIADEHPDVVVEVWERVKAAARQELASGHRAARTVEAYSSPWHRARFLAIRQMFSDGWQPRDGVEWGLIDTLAQCHLMYLYWLEQHFRQSETEGQREAHSREKDGYWKPPRIETAAAMEQSAAMAERFHRLFIRTLRALRDLRRYGPAVVVNHGQLNVAAVQSNTATHTTPTDSAPPADHVPAG